MGAKRYSYEANPEVRDRVDNGLWILISAEEHSHENMPAYRLEFQKDDAIDVRVYAFCKKGLRFQEALDGLKRSVGKVVVSLMSRDLGVRIDFADSSWIYFGEG